MSENRESKLLCLFLTEGWPCCAVYGILLLWPGTEPLSPALGGRDSVAGSPGKSQKVSWVTQSCPTLCNPMDCSMSGFPVHHQLPNLAQTHVHRVGNAIQSSRPLSSPSPPASVTLLRPVLFRCLSSHHAYLLSLLSFLFFLWVSTQKNSNISVLKCKS